MHRDLIFVFPLVDSNARWAHLGRRVTEEKNEDWLRSVEEDVAPIAGMVAGAYHTILWTHDGKVFTFGDGAYGELGREMKSVVVDDEPLGIHFDSKPTLIAHIEGVIGATSRHNHNVIWTNNGDFYTWGWDRCGQLGVDTQAYIEPCPILNTLLEKNVNYRIRVTGAATGIDHTVVWSDAGLAYSFGGGDFGQLGQGPNIDHSDGALIPGLSGVENMSAGEHHTIAQCTGFDNWQHLYSFGQPPFSEKLLNIPRDGGSSNDASWRFIPTELNIEQLCSDQVKGFSTGEPGSIIWSKNGDAFILSSFIFPPWLCPWVRVQDLPQEWGLVDKKIISASITPDSFVMATRDGDIYSLGGKSFGHQKLH